MAELELSAQNPQIWNNPGQLQKLNQEKIFLEKSIHQFEAFARALEDANLLLDMAIEAHDEANFQEAKAEVLKLKEQGSELEVQRLLSGELDSNGTYLSIHAGAGGTEACDWAGMLLRMYLRFADKMNYRTEVLEMSEGEGAGIKSVTLLIEGAYAYGHLKAESGVHRLVRISPFDSNARRHTSFASVFAWAEVDDDIEIEVNMADVVVETYRSSGAGGQHVNKTDSAVRMRHLPSGIVVQCQSQRSQIQNRDKALKMLKAALYEREVEERNRKKAEMEATKKANEWGSQIRSYVMHPYQMVKDHRTQFESNQVHTIMDGDIKSFIMAFLKSPLNPSVEKGS